MNIDALHLAVALVPLAGYFLALAHVHMARRPVVVSGWRDTLGLGLGISGLVMSGPMELFFPESAATVFGGYVWLLMLFLYLLLLVLIGMVQRPRLVIYGTRRSQAQERVDRAIAQLDPLAEWSGTVCRLPALGIQFELDESASMHVVQLVGLQTSQSPEGWWHFARALRRELADVRTGPRSAGLRWLISALFILGVATYGVWLGGDTLAAEIREMLRL